MLKIRLIGTTRPRGWTHSSVIFDHAFSSAESAGLLCWGAPEPELLRYRGHKAWYYPEPRKFGIRRAQTFRRTLRYLDQKEFLHHSNINLIYRYPVATHYSPMTLFCQPDRREKFVAVVSNFGGRLWWLHSGARLRNSFVLHKDVALFGNPKSWCHFRRHPWSFPATPANYSGEWPSNWYMPEHTQHLSNYRSAICLENTLEPFYFTEKFVNACRAGCVPVYCAHPSVRDGVLLGARWIDPADYSFNVDATLEAAARCDAQEITQNNLKWLQSNAVRQTDGYAIWTRIAEHFLRACGSAAAAQATVAE